MSKEYPRATARVMAAEILNLRSVVSFHFSVLGPIALVASRAETLAPAGRAPECAHGSPSCGASTLPPDIPRMYGPPVSPCQPTENHE